MRVLADGHEVARDLHGRVRRPGQRAQTLQVVRDLAGFERVQHRRYRALQEAQAFLVRAYWAQWASKCFGRWTEWLERQKSLGECHLSALELSSGL
jgi:hypothetical protein